MWGRSARIAKCLESGLLDFLSALLPMEAGGVKLYDLLEQAASGGLRLPPCYVKVAMMYSFLERSLGSPYLALKYLAKSLGGSRLGKLLWEYNEISLTAGDALRFLEGAMNSYIGHLRGRLEKSLRLLEGIYEGIIVLVMSTILLSTMPSQAMPPLISQAIISLSLLAGYFYSLRLSRSLMSYSGRRGLLDSLIIALGAISSLHLYLAIAHAISLFSIALALRGESGRARGLEDEALGLLEDAYVNVNSGLTLDASLRERLRLGSAAFKRAWFIAERGADARALIEQLNATTLTIWSFSALVGAMEYTSRHGPYLSKAVLVVDSLREAREYIAEKLKALYAYPIVVTALAIFSAISLRQYGLVAGDKIPYGLIYAGALAMAAPLAVLESGRLSYSARSSALLLLSALSLLAASTL